MCSSNQPWLPVFCLSLQLCCKRTLLLQCLHRLVSPGPRAALQLRHASRTFANLMMPPAARDGVDSWIARVWSPVTKQDLQNPKMSKNDKGFTLA